MKLTVTSFLMTASSTSTRSRSPHISGKRGVTGLQNIGNTCFLNSVIQCLSNTKPLLEYILKEEYQNDIKHPLRNLLIRRFCDLIQSIWGEQSGSLNTYSLKSAIVFYAPRFNKCDQQDAQELLRCLLDGLHEEINRARQTRSSISDQLTFQIQQKKDALSAEETWQRYLETDNSKIVDIFGGLLRSVLQCTFCGFTSTVFEPFLDLSLPIPSNSEHSLSQRLRLNHCLDLFTKEERLEGNERPTCSQCKTKQTSIKRISIERHPQILVLHLKRFSNGGMSNKVDTYVDYPVDGLNMTAYSAQAPRRSILYNLYGVVNHYGSCQFGHYTACCKHPYTKDWHRFNDRVVIPISSDETDRREAYILFYEIDTNI